MKQKLLWAAIFVMMATMQAKAQFMPSDADTKYAKELLKPGTPAPDFQVRKGDQGKVRGTGLLGLMVPRLPKGCTQRAAHV